MKNNAVKGVGNVQISARFLLAEFWDLLIFATNME